MLLMFSSSICLSSAKQLGGAAPVDKSWHTELLILRPPRMKLWGFEAEGPESSPRRESVSKNRGVPESVWGSALGALLKVT